TLKDNKKHMFSSLYNLREVKEASTEYNINDNGIGVDKESQQCVREAKLNTSEQETNNITSTVSLSSTSTQTVNLSDPKSTSTESSSSSNTQAMNLSDQKNNSTVYLSSTNTQTLNISHPKSLTYLIQGLISHGIRKFCIDESILFIKGKTEGVCRISSVDPRLSSVSLYCEYELGNDYLHLPDYFAGYLIALKSPFRLDETKIITRLDESKTKFLDNDNYIIEFDEFIESSLDISDPSTGTISRQKSAATQTRTVMTQTKTHIEDKKTLTYIAKDPKLKGMTLTCNYKLAKGFVNFQGEIGYPMIVISLYGSVKTILKQNMERILVSSNAKEFVNKLAPNCYATITMYFVYPSSIIDLWEKKVIMGGGKPTYLRRPSQLPEKRLFIE
ncbi:14139_t:CDS:2, partial [Acaulospora morrowiae]